MRRPTNFVLMALLAGPRAVVPPLACGRAAYRAPLLVFDQSGSLLPANASPPSCRIRLSLRTGCGNLRRRRRSLGDVVRRLAFRDNGDRT